MKEDLSLDGYGDWLWSYTSSIAPSKALLLRFDRLAGSSASLWKKISSMGNDGFWRLWFQNWLFGNDLNWFSYEFLSIAELWTRETSRSSLPEPIMWQGCSPERSWLLFGFDHRGFPLNRRYGPVGYGNTVPDHTFIVDTLLWMLRIVIGNLVAPIDDWTRTWS